MKLLSFRVGGQASYGIVTDRGVIDAGRRLRDRFLTLSTAIGGGALSELKKLAASGEVDHKLADVTFLPVIPDPQKILCVGINYAAHYKETGPEVPTNAMIFCPLSNT